jgi:AcrR family transcriptional regulator
MATRTSSVKKPVSDKKILEAALALIAEKGLGKARLSDLAKQVKIPLPELYKTYPSVNAIVKAYINQIDDEMLKNVAASSGSKRDMYFDMVMSRMDSLQVYRPGMVRWLRDVIKQPSLWATTFKRWEQSLSLMLDVAKDSPLYPVKKLGLAGIYLITLRTWIDDETADMSKTMATLDDALGRAESIGERFMNFKRAA